MSQYELSAEEESVIARMRMTKDELASEAVRQEEREESQLISRLTASEYADVLAFREKVASQTDAERKADHCAFLQQYVAKSVGDPDVASAIRSKVDGGEIDANLFAFA